MASDLLNREDFLVNNEDASITLKFKSTNFSLIQAVAVAATARYGFKRRWAIKYKGQVIGTVLLKTPSKA